MEPREGRTIDRKTRNTLRASGSAVPALLLRDDKQFAHNSAVKSEFVRSYIKTGQIDAKWNRFYQELFDDKQEGDYIPTATFETSELSMHLRQAREFIDLIRGLIASR